MARNVGTVLENNLSRGLITEAHGLNFPDNAVTEAKNVVFERIGQVRRRLGIDIEGGAETVNYDEDDGIVKEFIWTSVGKRGGFTFLVVQMGRMIHFFELTVSDALSAGVQAPMLDLNDFRAPGAGDIREIPASFSSGSGYLFVTHPRCDPVVIRFNPEEEWFEAARVRLFIRDFEGVPDGLPVNANPTELSDAHHYNLRNQGWNRGVRVGSANNEANYGGAGQAPVYFMGYNLLDLLLGEQAADSEESIVYSPKLEWWPMAIQGED